MENNTLLKVQIATVEAINKILLVELGKLSDMIYGNLKLDSIDFKTIDRLAFINSDLDAEKRTVSNLIKMIMEEKKGEKQNE